MEQRKPIQLYEDTHEAFMEYRKEDGFHSADEFVAYLLTNYREGDVPPSVLDKSVEYKKRFLEIIGEDN